MSKRSAEEISADQEKLVANVLVDLLGRDHKALNSDEQKPKPIVEKNSWDGDIVYSKVGFSNPGSALKLREFLAERTGQRRLSVSSFKSSTNGYEAEVAFPCNAVKDLMKWVTSFEEAIQCPFRATRVENVPATSRLNAFKGKRKCACKRNVIDKNGIHENEVCNAVIRMALRKNGIAHVYLFMEHNHDLSDFEMTKNCRPQLTRNQKRMMIDLFQAGLTPVEVIDHLNTFVPCGNTFPGCTSKSCVNQMKDGHGFNYSSVHNDFSYRQVYHLFNKFKQESEKNFNIEQLRSRLDAEIDQFRRRMMRSPRLIVSTLCFFNTLNSKCDQAVSDLLINCDKGKVGKSSQMKSDAITSNILIENASMSYLTDASSSSYKGNEKIILEGTTDPEDYEEQIIVVDDLPPCEMSNLSSRSFFTTEDSRRTLKIPETPNSSIGSLREGGPGTGRMPLLKLNKKIEDCNCNVGTSKVGTTLDSFDCERLTGSPSLLLDVSSRKGPPYSSVDRFAASREASSSMTPLIPSATMSSLSSANLHVASPILGSSSTNTVQRAFLQATTSSDAYKKEDTSGFPDVFCTPKNEGKASMLDISLEPVCSASSADALESSFSLEDLFRTPQGSKIKVSDEIISTAESPLASLLNSSGHPSGVVSSDVTNGIEDPVVAQVTKVSSKIEPQTSSFIKQHPSLTGERNSGNEINVDVLKTTGSRYLEPIDVIDFENGYIESEIEIE